MLYKLRPSQRVLVDDRFTVHELYSEYPDGVIDVEREQALVEEHQNIVLSSWCTGLTAHRF